MEALQHGHSTATWERPLGHSWATAGRHGNCKKMSYMDQCTFGAVRPRGAAAILEFWRAKEEIRPPEPNALKTGFREAADRLPAHRR